MKTEQEGGKVFRIRTDYFLLLEDGKKIVKATKRDIEKSLTEKGQKDFKAFMKQYKIKWKDESSLIKVLQFFN